RGRRLTAGERERGRGDAQRAAVRRGGRERDGARDVGRLVAAPVPGREEDGEGNARGRRRGRAGGVERGHHPGVDGERVGRGALPPARGVQHQVDSRPAHRQAAEDGLAGAGGLVVVHVIGSGRLPRAGRPRGEAQGDGEVVLVVTVPVLD